MAEIHRQLEPGIPAIEFAPQWTWRAVVAAGMVTLSLFILLPYLERLSAPSAETLSLRQVGTALPPPAAPPPPPPQRKAPAQKTPQPQLEKTRRRLLPLQAKMDLNMALGNISGDFSVDFGVSTPDLTGQIKELIFDIGELDEPPRPLARLTPVYPPQARMRRIEGMVVVEFIVTPDGFPQSIEVVSAQPGDIFVNAALRAIERWRFSPGRKDGRAVATRVRQTVSFQLK